MVIHNKMIVLICFSSSRKILSSIDLREVSDISHYQKGEIIDKSRFNIAVGEKMFKFKASTAEEGERWVQLLQRWREYFLFQV